MSAHRDASPDSSPKPAPPLRSSAKAFPPLLLVNSVTPRPRGLWLSEIRFMLVPLERSPSSPSGAVASFSKYKVLCRAAYSSSGVDLRLSSASRRSSWCRRSVVDSVTPGGRSASISTLRALPASCEGSLLLFAKTFSRASSVCGCFVSSDFATENFAVADVDSPLPVTALPAKSADANGSADAGVGAGDAPVRTPAVLPEGSELLPHASSKRAQTAAASEASSSALCRRMVWHAPALGRISSQSCGASRILLRAASCSCSCSTPTAASCASVGGARAT
mmetsp:Transcript_22291/g.56345  ORF Transcript_22291/g.56345 Transcript_22291/m.56345 type:complete len:279 (-) Transcript_22291:254-1090(-)